MNRRQYQRQRRHSLPGTSTHDSLGIGRVVPQGSNDFKKALEELLKHEPNHASYKSTVETTLYGLNVIEEDNESDCLDSDNLAPKLEDDMQTLYIHRSYRRHSMPSIAVDNSEEYAHHNHEHLKTNRMNSFGKEYSKRHGYWPISNEIKPTNVNKAGSIVQEHGKQTIPRSKLSK